MIEFLLRNNANPNISNSRGHGFLILLIRLCLHKPEMLKKIMDLVRDTNIKFDLLFKDDNNNSAIDFLLKFGYKLDPLFSAVLFSSCEFYSLKHLSDESEKICVLLNTMEALKSNFNQKPQTLQKFIPLAKKIHRAFSKIKKEELAITHVSLASNNTRTSIPDSSSNQTPPSKSSEQPSIRNNHHITSNKIPKGVLGKAQVEARLREKKEKHKLEKSVLQKKVIPPRAPSKPKKTEPPKLLLPELPILANSPSIEKIPGRGPRSLPISGKEGFSIYIKGENEKITPVKIKKSKRGERQKPQTFKWLPEQRKRIEIAHGSLQQCESLALRLQHEEFQFSKDLMTQVYKKSFEYHFLRGLEALTPTSKSRNDSRDASLFKAFEEQHLAVVQLRNVRNWIRSSFPSIKCATLQNLALKFNSAEVLSKLHYFLNINKINKDCKGLNLSEFIFLSNAYKLKLEKLDV